jgi:hypothetical protein
MRLQEGSKYHGFWNLIVIQCIIPLQTSMYINKFYQPILPYDNDAVLFYTAAQRVRNRTMLDVRLVVPHCILEEVT